MFGGSGDSSDKEIKSPLVGLKTTTEDVNLDELLQQAGLHLTKTLRFTYLKRGRTYQLFSKYISLYLLYDLVEINNFYTKP